MNVWTYRLLGAIVAMGAFTLASTVLKGTGAETTVTLLGGTIMGWLGMAQPTNTGTASIKPPAATPPGNGN